MHQDEAALLTALASDDEDVVIKALHQACPCSGSSTFYERHAAALHALKSDPRPAVRAVAIHLEVDALDTLRVQDEEANGFFRNPRGGSGRKGQTRRAAIRQGW